MIGQSTTVTHFILPAVDCLTYDYLPHFPSILSFINDAIQTDDKKKVLLFCHAGVSRSGTIAVLYLMQKYDLTYHEALRRVKQARDVCEPNDHFRLQVLLFQAMGYTFDASHSLYKAWLGVKRRASPSFGLNRIELDALTQYTQQHFHNPRKAVADQEGLITLLCPASPKLVVDEDAERPHFKTLCSLKCGKCRQVVAQADEVDHTHPKETCQAHYLNHPPAWMQQDASQNTQKIHCPSCAAKLGSIAWSGSPCRCGQWVVPSFQFIASKVDPVYKAINGTSG